MTDNPTEYTAHDEGIIASALDQAWRTWDARPAAAAGGGGDPTGMRVTGHIEWSGDVDRANGGRRTTRLDNLRTGDVRAAVAAYRRAEERAGAARPAVSYKAKGWLPQLNQILGTRRGAAASARAGLDVTPRTLRAWLAGDREPSKANRAKIDAAYGELRTWRVTQAQAEVARARHELTEKFTDALRDRYGAEIRIRDITGLDLN